MKSAAAMPESKYSYGREGGFGSFAEIVTSCCRYILRTVFKRQR